MHVLVIVRVTSFFIYTFFFHIIISYYLIILGFFVVVVFSLFFRGRYNIYVGVTELIQFGHFVKLHTTKLAKMPRLEKYRRFVAILPRNIFEGPKFISRNCK